jgi:hypothetical protein
MSERTELELAAARIASRLCPRCGDPAAAGVQLCGECRALANERNAASMASTRRARRKRQRCVDCERRTRRFRCWRCALRRKIREALGADLIHTMDTGDSGSPIVHNEGQTEGAAHRGGAPTIAPSDPGRREAERSGGAA